MMFSTAQLDFLEMYIPKLIDEGFNYYIARTNTDTRSGSYNTTLYDLVIYASSESFTNNNDGTFSSNGVGYIEFHIWTSNYNYRSSYSYSGPRIIYTSEPASDSMTFPVYEHIVSNCDFQTSGTLLPDVQLKYSTSQQYSFFNTSSVFLGVILFLCLIANFFKKRWFDL